MCALPVSDSIELLRMQIIYTGSVVDDCVCVPVTTTRPPLLNATSQMISYVFVLVIRNTTQKMCVAFFQSAVCWTLCFFFLSFGYLLYVKPNTSLRLAKFVRLNRPTTTTVTQKKTSSSNHRMHCNLIFYWKESDIFFNKLEYHEKLLTFWIWIIFFRKKTE